MSQQKVDQYKKDKANRQQIMKKEKFIRRVEYSVTVLIICLLLVWCGVSIVQKVQEKKAEQVETVELDNTAIDDYITGLDAEAEDTEEESSQVESAAEEGTEEESTNEE